MEEDFRQDLFTACSNLFEVHHVHEGSYGSIASNANHQEHIVNCRTAGAECIFAVLNESTLRSVYSFFRDAGLDAATQVNLSSHEDIKETAAQRLGR